jgi:hypothetical protein
MSITLSIVHNYYSYALSDTMRRLQVALSVELGERVETIST